MPELHARVRARGSLGVHRTHARARARNSEDRRIRSLSDDVMNLDPPRVGGERLRGRHSERPS